MIQLFWETVWQFLIKRNASMCPKDPTPRYLPRKNRNSDFSNFINNSDKMETTLMSLWDKMVMWYVYTVECYTAVKRMNYYYTQSEEISETVRETGHDKEHTT